MTLFAPTPSNVMTATMRQSSDTALIDKTNVIPAAADGCSASVRALPECRCKSTATRNTVEKSGYLKPKSAFPSSYKNCAPMSEESEVFSRKVFVGGIPVDIKEEEFTSTFSQFGNVFADWPRRSTNTSKESRSHSQNRMPGYVFLVYESERSVRRLLASCYKENNQYFMLLSSPTMKNKPVQVRPWRIADINFMINPAVAIDPRRTVFIGGVPRPTKARQLAESLYGLYGTVSYAEIDVDPDLMYPKGAARITFATHYAFFSSIKGRFVDIPHAGSYERVEVKPYIMDAEMCDECCGTECKQQYAPYFCGAYSCLQYFCESCWDFFHYGPYSNDERASHKPLVRVGDRVEELPYPPHRDKSAKQNGIVRAVDGICSQNAKWLQLGYFAEE